MLSQYNIVPKAPVYEHPEDHMLMCKCAWCYPPGAEETPPLPDGKIAYSDEICKPHYKVEMERLKQRKLERELQQKSITMEPKQSTM